MPLSTHKTGTVVVFSENVICKFRLTCSITIHSYGKPQSSPLHPLLRYIIQLYCNSYIVIYANYNYCPRLTNVIKQILQLPGCSTLVLRVHINSPKYWNFANFSSKWQYKPELFAVYRSYAVRVSSTHPGITKVINNRNNIGKYYYKLIQFNWNDSGITVIDVSYGIHRKN